MASKRCGLQQLLLLGLLLLATPSKGHNLNQCQVPRLDQEFCNSFYSVCLASPDKLCLAQSMSQCLNSTSFPSGLLYSIRTYLLEFIQNLSVIINPPEIGESGMSPPLPPTQPLPPTTPPRPIYWPLIPPQPPKVSPPRPLPPPLPQPLPQPPQLPWWKLITMQPPQVPQPQPLPPPPRPPIFVIPSPPPPQLPPPFVVRRPQPQPLPPAPQPLPPPPRPPIFVVPSPPQTLLPPPPQTLLPPPQITYNVTRPIFIPSGPSISFWPPQVNSSIKMPYQTGNDYLDYCISLLLSLPEQQIQNIIGYMIRDINIGGTSQGQVRSQDVDILLLKLKYLLQQYSFQNFDANYLDTSLYYLLNSNASLFNWFSTVLDQIFLNLKIQLPVGGTVPSPSFTLEGVFSTNIAYRQSVENCNGAPASEAVCERYCTHNYGGNWIAIQLRERNLEQPGTFDRNLNEYIRGFGDYQSGYWMGLACLKDITNRYKMELLVELADASGVTALAHYGNFRVGDQSAGYPLQLGPFLGGALGDGLRSADGRPFTTRDKDMDQYVNNCAVKLRGGWWYANCGTSSVKNFLNGYFSRDSTKSDLAANSPYFGVSWETFDTTYVIVSTRIFMRQVSAMNEIGFPMYGGIAGPQGLATFGGAMGLGGETYGVGYSGGVGSNVGGDLYGMTYSGGVGSSAGGGGDLYGMTYSGGVGSIVGGGGDLYVGGDTYDYYTGDYV